MLTQAQKDRKIKTAETDVEAATARLKRAKDRLEKFDQDVDTKRAELKAAVATLTKAEGATQSTLDWWKKAPVLGDENEVETDASAEDGPLLAHGLAERVLDSRIAAG
jgi:peptidoglycan hydrolase CwlO-like protein